MRGREQTQTNRPTRGVGWACRVLAPALDGGDQKGCSLVSRGANLVVAGGVVSGTWSVTDDRAAVAWFDGDPPETALAAEVERLAGILGRPLRPAVGAG